MKRTFVYAITLLLGLSLFSFYAKAQNWQAYKGVWLKGYDNATQAPVPPSGYSALTYFADSLGTYVYDWDSLAWLRIPGTGGGGGLATADNGLSVNPAGNVRLGGSPLLQNTTVGGGSSIGTARNLTLGASNDWLNSFSVNAGGTATEQGRLVVSNAGINLQMFRNPALGKSTLFSIPTLNPVSFTIDSLSTSATHNFLIYSDKIVGSIENVRYFTLSPTQTRFNTNAIFLSKTPTTLDTAQWFLARDFTTGEIVQRKITGGGGGFVTADNGLTASSPTNVQLGGTLIQNTTIPLAGFSYTIGQFPDNVNFSVNDASNSITANLSSGSSGALFSMTASNAVFQHSGAAGTATLTLNQSTETATISSSSGSQIHFNAATPASPVITTQAAENFTISKPLGLASSSGSLQIGGPDGLVTSLENTESGNTAIFDVRGTNQTFAMRSGSGGSTLGISVATPDSVRLNVGDVDMWINDADNDISMGTAISRLKFDFSNPAQPAIGVTEPFAGVNATLTLRTAGNGGFFIEKDVPGETYFTMSQAGTMQLGSNQVGGEFWTISAVNPTSDANLSLNAQEGIRLIAGNSFVQLGSGGAGTYTIGGGTNGILNGNGTNIVIQPGVENGSGTPGNLTLDALSGFLIISNIPTSDPCGSAPSGTVWNNSGVLNICP